MISIVVLKFRTRMKMSTKTFFVTLCGVVMFAYAGYGQKQAPLEEVVRAAALRSTLASPGAAPFHLHAKISDEKEHNPQWDADVEEWWESSTRWRREFIHDPFRRSWS
jgi:hypothetical protein